MFAEKVHTSAKESAKARMEECNERIHLTFEALFGEDTGKITNGLFQIDGIRFFGTWVSGETCRFYVLQECATCGSARSIEFWDFETLDDAITLPFLHKCLKEKGFLEKLVGRLTTL